eukprot:gene4158-5205_t
MKSLAELTLRTAQSLSYSEHECSPPELKYCGEKLAIARVDGTVGRYKVTIKIKNGKLWTDCTCPSNSYSNSKSLQKK